MLEVNKDTYRRKAFRRFIEKALPKDRKAPSYWCRGWGGAGKGEAWEAGYEAYRWDVEDKVIDALINDYDKLQKLLKEIDEQKDTKDA